MSLPLLTTNDNTVKLRGNGGATYMVADGQTGKAVRQKTKGDSLETKWVVETVTERSTTTTTIRQNNDHSNRHLTATANNTVESAEEIEPTIRLKNKRFDDSNRYLTATANNMVEAAEEIEPRSMQTWKVTGDGNGVRLQNVKSGLFLRANRTGEQLSVVQYPPGSATAIQSLPDTDLERAIRWIPEEEASPVQDQRPT